MSTGLRFECPACGTSYSAVTIGAAPSWPRTAAAGLNGLNSAVTGAAQAPVPGTNVCQQCVVRPWTVTAPTGVNVCAGCYWALTGTHPPQTAAPAATPPAAVVPPPVAPGLCPGCGLHSSHASWCPANPSSTVAQTNQLFKRAFAATLPGVAPAPVAPPRRSLHSYVYDSDADDPPAPLARPKIYPCCTRCRREMSPELDAYYGRDPYEAAMCDPCRRGRPLANTEPT